LAQPVFGTRKHINISLLYHDGGKEKIKEKLRKGDNTTSMDYRNGDVLSDSEVLTLQGGFKPATPKSLA
jgi:hypothetical protein